MSRIAYVNGRYTPHRQAMVHIEDRGYQFGDGVYEVWAVRGGLLRDAPGHFARLLRSLRELRIRPPMGEAAMGVMLRELVRRNRVQDGLVYLQITRGVSPRDHAFPGEGVAPAIVATARRLPRALLDQRAREGVAVLTVPDTRWSRADIKALTLLPNVLAKQAARETGAFEAWFVDAAGLVTEGASTNAWIVTPDDVLVTRETSANILRGVTRLALLEIARHMGMRVEERGFTVTEAMAAKEAFISSAGGGVAPVVIIDGAPVGDGKAGPIALRLREAYLSGA